MTNFLLIALTCILTTQAQDFTYQHLGCYRDHVYNGRALSERSYNMLIHQATIPNCLSFCYNEGFKYAGVQSGYQCRCGNSDTGYSKYGTARNCNILCRGDPNAYCGGDWSNDVYRIDRIAILPPTSMSTTTIIQPTTTTVTTIQPTTSRQSNTITAAQSSTRLTPMLKKPVTANIDLLPGMKSGQREEDIGIYIGSGIGVLAVCVVVIAAVVIILRRRRNEEKLRNNVTVQYSNETYSSNSNPRPGHYRAPNGDSYACVVKAKPSEGVEFLVEDEMSEQENIYANTDRSSPIYSNTTASYTQTNQPIYSLADPIVDDRVIVENDLYGS